MAAFDWIHRVADRLAEHPVAFHWLRKLPEANFRATKARIAAVRDGLGDPRALDLGCGTGQYSTLFAPDRYVGVDLSPGYVAYAQRLHPAYTYRCGDARSWQRDGDPFELVLVNGVLHHLDDADARALLHAARGHVAPGGTLLVIEDVRLAEASAGARLMHLLDYGEHIRDVGEWQALVSEVAPIARSETYTSGICPYHLMQCKPA